MRGLIIHNPQSGFGSDAIFEFERAFMRGGDECVMRMNDKKTALEELLFDAESFDVVVASGGDGTISSVLYAMRGKETPVCCFPSGTANLLCDALGIALEPAALARACRELRCARIDLGELTWGDKDEYTRGFAVMSGSGYDADLMQAALPTKRIMGPVAYYAAAFANPRPVVADFAVTVDGVRHEERGICCLAANTARLQGGIDLIADAHMQDGQLEAILVTTEYTAQLLRPLLFSLVDKRGKTIGRPHLKHLQGQEISVTSSKPMALEIDGDVVSQSCSAFSVRVLPAAVRIVIDPMSTLVPEDEAATLHQ